MGEVNGMPRFPVFVGLSLALHGALAAEALHGGPTPPVPTFDTSPAPLAGESLEIEPPRAAAADEEEAERAPGATAADTHGDEARRTRRSSASPVRSFATPAPATPDMAAAPTPALFGAVGLRYATDLARTFTHAFPQAASADPVWNTAPVGPAGTADVAIALDEGGHVVATSISGSPSPALRRGIERTLVLLGPRAFTARSATTRLRLTARITRDLVHDGLHGDVFALSGSGGGFSGDTGTAFFALPAANGPGRRIDVELRLLP